MKSQTRAGRTAIWFILGVGAGAALLWRWPRAKEQPRSATVELPEGFVRPTKAFDPNDSVAVAVAERNAALARAVREMASAEHAAKPAPSASNAATSDPQALDPHAHSELDLRREQQVIAQFDGDAAPTAQSFQMKRQLSDVLGGMSDRGVDVQNVECHFRICKMELTFDSVDSDISVLKELFVKNASPEIAKYGQAIAPTREYLPDGKVKTTVYVAREGTIELFD